MYAKRIGESEETNASEASVVFALPGNDPLHGAEPSSFLLSLSLSLSSPPRPFSQERDGEEDGGEGARGRTGRAETFLVQSTTRTGSRL